MKNSVKIRNPVDLSGILAKWGKRRQENFLVVTLNGKHETIKIHHISKGLVNRTVVHPREVFFPAIKDNAVAVAFAHNHPSGSTDPSENDDDITKRLCMAAKILGFNVLDHLIITNREYYSYRVNGKLNDPDSGYGDDSFLKDEKFELFANEIAAEKNRKNY